MIYSQVGWYRKRLVKTNHQGVAVSGSLAVTNNFSYPTTYLPTYTIALDTLDRTDLTTCLQHSSSSLCPCANYVWDMALDSDHSEMFHQGLSPVSGKLFRPVEVKSN